MVERSDRIKILLRAIGTEGHRPSNHLRWAVYRLPYKISCRTYIYIYRMFVPHPVDEVCIDCADQGFDSSLSAKTFAIPPHLSHR